MGIYDIIRFLVIMGVLVDDVGLFHIHLHIFLQLSLNCVPKCTDIYNGLRILALKVGVVVERGSTS